MEKITLPALPVARPSASVSYDIAPHIAEHWNGEIRAASTDENTISIYDTIGPDYWGEGVTAKRIAGALRAIGGADVTVNINSPGGDVWEGVAIYNLLREYQGKVTIKVLGLAASAASIIAMAGDEVLIGRAAFLMIHNGWVVAVGNRNDLRAIADLIEPIDRAIADVYAERTGIDAAELSQMMDDETYIGGQAAIDSGFADGLLAADATREASESPQNAARKLDLMLAKNEVPRSERRRLIKALKGFTPDAKPNPDSTPGAAEEVNSQTLASLQSALTGLQSLNTPE
jgi:ATP-dependent Clp protease, protease subunit